MVVVKLYLWTHGMALAFSHLFEMASDEEELKDNQYFPNSTLS